MATSVTLSSKADYLQKYTAQDDSKPVINKSDYLKRYISGTDSLKSKKKRRKKVVKSHLGCKIIDDDIGIKPIAPSTFAATSDQSESDEEDPYVVSVEDDASYKVKFDSTQWKVIGDTSQVRSPSSDSGDNERSQLHSNKERSNARQNKQDNDGDHQLSKSYKERHDSESDHTIPRSSKKRHDSDSDQSLPRSSRKEKNSDSDQSLHRTHKKSDQSHKQQFSKEHKSFPDSLMKTQVSIANLSHPKSSRNRHDSGSDMSPPRKRNVSGSDISPPRKRHDSGSDMSPPRKRHDSGSDMSPPRKRHNSGSDLSPPRRKQNSGSDLSPSHKGKPSLSHSERKSSSKRHRSERNEDSKRNHSPPRRSEMHRKDVKDRSSDKTEYSSSSKERPVKTLSGLKAGLQSAKVLRTELMDAKSKEKEHLKSISDDVLGRGAQTVFRERSTGKLRDLKEESRQEQLKKAKELEMKEKYAEWGKGLKQKDDQVKQAQEDLHEMTKPLARYKDDEDLDRHLKEQERLGDPMLQFMRKKKALGVPSRPVYKGPPPPPNRFNIMPGYRWDGVDRSNGFEKKVFDKQASKVAVEEEAYRWSTENM